MEDIGIAKDTVWLYRLGIDQVDISSTLLWVEYRPNAQALYEVFPNEAQAPVALVFIKNLLSEWPLKVLVMT